MAIYRFYSWFTHHKMVIFYSYVSLSEGNGENDDWPISGRVAPAIGRDTPPVPFARTAAGAPPPPHLRNGAKNQTWARLKLGTVKPLLKRTHCLQGRVTEPTEGKATGKHNGENNRGDTMRKWEMVVCGFLYTLFHWVTSDVNFTLCNIVYFFDGTAPLSENQELAR